MPARGDTRILEILDEALAGGPLDVMQILGALRSKAASLLGRHEGRLHAMLHGMVRRARLHVADVGENGLARYALGEGDTPAGAWPESGDTPMARRAHRLASGVRSPADRARVEADIRAHLDSLEKRGRLGVFGPGRNVRHLLRRADRKKPIVFFPSGAGDYIRKFGVEEGPWILAAILAFLVIRAFLAEVFFIPSSSMVPTLLEGDRVVVTKPGARGRIPERWSIVTFDRGGTTFVKRVIGLGGERVLLLGGDPYIDGELLVRPADLREDLRAAYRRWSLDGATTEWRVTEDGGERVLDYVGPTLWSGGFDGNGRPIHYHDVPLRDVYAVLDGERGAGATLVLELAYRSRSEETVPTRIALRAGDGGVAVTVVTPEGRRESFPVSGTAPTGSVRLELAYVDGHVMARVPGAGAQEVALDEGLRPRRDDVVDPRIRMGGAATARRFLLDKDHHYTWAGQRGVANPGSDEDPATYAHPIPEGTVFLLGDNSYSSNDGRFRSVGDIPVGDLIGPVVFRIWPPTRIGTVR